MKKRLRIFVITGLSFLIILFIIYCFVFFNSKGQDINNKENISEESLILNYQDYNLEKIRDLLVQVHNNHTYQYGSGLNKWNCYDYSKELEFILKENGFSVKCVFGNYAEDPENLYKVGNAHNWNLVYYNGREIPLDATVGVWFPDEESYKNYKLHYNVIQEKCL